jgi:hypothetical protein
MFIADPYGNAMEIKTMKNPDTLWKTNKWHLKKRQKSIENK